MAVVLKNLASVYSTTTGTGTVTLGAARDGFLTFAEAGFADGDTVTYSIRDGVNSEMGRGVYNSAGPTLTRATVLRSTGTANTGKINLSGANAIITATAAGEDLTDRLLKLNAPEDITAASTTDLGTLVGLYARINGNTGITSFGSKANVWCFLQFTGTPTITHGSALILPGSLPIAIKAGTTCIAASDESGHFRLFGLVGPDGQPLPVGITTLAVGSTMDLGSVLANEITGTGTGTVASLGSSAPLGTVKRVAWPADIVLTHNATALILPNDGKDITTIAGAVGEFRHESGPGNWRCTNWQDPWSPGPRKNYAGNPSFDNWQAGISFASGNLYIADLWQMGNASNRTMSRQTGFSGALYCCRVQRNVGTTGVGGAAITHQVSKEFAAYLAGKTVVISADLRAGANFSAAGGLVSCVITYGTGTEETVTSLAFPTGSATAGSASVAVTTTEKRYAFAPISIPSNATEVLVRPVFTPVGTAGAADYFEITNVKWEVGSIATPFEPEPMAAILAACMRRYRKSFQPATAPAQSVGAGTGELTFPALTVAALAQRSQQVIFGEPMRAVPTITLYNPSAGNAQVRDETAAGDCSASASANVNESGFAVTATGNASTAVANALGVHWTADARI